MFLLNGKSIAGSSSLVAVPMTMDRRTRGLLRYVKINERSLTQTIQRFGGGERGLQVLLYHIMLWVEEQRNGTGGVIDVDSIVKGFEHLFKLNYNACDVEGNCIIPANHVINSPTPCSDNSTANTSEHPYHPITGKYGPCSLYCPFFFACSLFLHHLFIAKKHTRASLLEAESEVILYGAHWN